MSPSINSHVAMGEQSSRPVMFQFSADRTITPPLIEVKQPAKPPAASHAAHVLSVTGVR
jgi:hypothetical protein